MEAGFLFGVSGQSLIASSGQPLAVDESSWNVLGLISFLGVGLLQFVPQMPKRAGGLPCSAAQREPLRAPGGAAHT